MFIFKVYYFGKAFPYKVDTLGYISNTCNCFVLLRFGLLVPLFHSLTHSLTLTFLITVSVGLDCTHVLLRSTSGGGGGTQARAHHGHHGAGRVVPGGAAAGEGLRGARHHPQVLVLQHVAHWSPLQGQTRGACVYMCSCVCVCVCVHVCLSQCYCFSVSCNSTVNSSL